MPTATLGLEEALKILEIKDIHSLKTDEDFKKLTKKAKRRWHPDTIASLRPSKETIKRYEQNFNLVDEAIVMLKSYLTEEFHTSAKAPTYDPPPPPKEPEEIIRENAPDIQATLRKLWEKVKELKYKLREQIITVAEGPLYSELLEQDLEDNMPVLAIMSAFYGLFWLAILGGIITALLENNVAVANLFALIYIALVFLQPLSCIFALLPLSRVWLPEPLRKTMIVLVNAGLTFPHLLEKLGLMSFTPVLFLFHLVPFGLASLIKWVIIYPLYAIAGSMLKEKRMGRVQETVHYYAGMAEWYIERLINTAPDSLSKSELFDLSAIYSEFRAEDLH